MIDDRILISEGDGGRLSAKLIQEIFIKAYGNDKLNRMDDAADISIGDKRIAMTTDSYVIKPIFFPGGDIGKLSVCGTVNDLATKAAKPVAISAAFIIEEGFLKSDLKKIVDSMHKTAKEVGVDIVTGDTKVVRKGEADGIFINTTGIGLIQDGFNLSSANARAGDDIIITGSIADHGIAILNQRENLNFSPAIQSDVAPLYSIVQSLKDLAKDIHVMRDPTRGGVASSLNEIATASAVNIEVFYNYPIKQEVRACCELLGIDPLYIANEGKMLIFADPKKTKEIINKINRKDCSVIGKVLDTGKFSKTVPPVYLLTNIGSKRVLSMMDGTPLPRIC
jgi:hydrogenase expression/formation protein HypE